MPLRDAPLKETGEWKLCGKCRMITHKFSVAMCVYRQDQPEWFDAALGSIIKQTAKPAEIVLVADGPITEKLQKVINKYSAICNMEGIAFKAIYSAENQGLGKSLEVAVENCSNGLVARMDSDDIAVENRFEIQLQAFADDPILSICGGQIEEFRGELGCTVGKRMVPQNDWDIKKYMKHRCPFNHMTVMFRKEDVLRVGGYQEWFWNEDYYLWIRMALAGSKFGNVPQTLVHVRVGADMYMRRGGMKYFKSEVGIQKYMLRKKIIGIPVFLPNCAIRLIIQVLMPNGVRGWAFRTFARK